MSAAGEKWKTACVTGGNGYIASALIKMLLQKGYAVKTTVREPGRILSADTSCPFSISRASYSFDLKVLGVIAILKPPDDMAKNSHLKDLQALGPLEAFRADLDEEGSFDEAVAGCDYAFLVAAPMNIASEDPEKELIEAAVRGTLNVMRSCVKAGTVKRVILTSSAASVFVRPDLQGDGHVLDEESWSDVDYLTATKSAFWAYAVSKVLLEKEACRFAQEHGISLVTVCPVITVGAAPAPRARTRVPEFLSLLSGDEAKFAVLRVMEAAGIMALVHVEDLCRAELFVAEEDAAAGRYLCSSVNTTVREIASFLSENYPQYTVKTNLLAGDLPEKPRIILSSAKLTREGFEYKYKTLDGIYDDMIEHGKALGILPNQ